MTHVLEPILYSVGTEYGSNEQGDFFYSAGQHRNLHKLQNLGRSFGKNEGEWTGKVEINSRKKSMAVDEACMAIF